MSDLLLLESILNDKDGDLLEQILNGTDQDLADLWPDAGAPFDGGVGLGGGRGGGGGGRAGGARGGGGGGGSVSWASSA